MPKGGSWSVSDFWGIPMWAGQGETVSSTAGGRSIMDQTRIKETNK